MSTPVDKLRELLDVAAGRREADLYLEGGNLVNVLSGEIYQASVAVLGDKIAYVGAGRKMVGPGTTVIDAGGHYVCPALIEPHAHPWGVYNPASLAEASLCRGITTLVCDNLFFFVHLGARGFLKLAASLDSLPLRFKWLARVIPQSPDSGEEETFSIEKLKEVFADPHVIKIAEVTRWPLIVQGEESLLEKICLAGEHGVGMEGHTAGCSYDRLNVVAASGTESCHEAITAEDVANRVRLGFYALLRHNSFRPDLPALLPAITEKRLYTGRMVLTSDGASPNFIDKEGLLDGMLRLSVAAGINPVTALQMATLNPATYLGLDRELGSVAPGRAADILLLPDLEKFNPHMVFSRGKLAAVDGKLTAPLAAPDWGEIGFRPAVLPAPEKLLDSSLYGVPAEQPVDFPVIDAVSTVITRRRDRLLQPGDGFLERDDEVLYCALIDRYGKWAVNGFVSGLGSFEAFAATFNTSYNLLVFGKDRASMARAAAGVAAMGGGMALAEGGQVTFRLPLKLGGMMSDMTFAEVVYKVTELEGKVRGAGYPHEDFLFTMLFLVCDFLPGLRITAAGIMDVKDKKVLVPARSLPL
ncbi:MAG: adenine deaminase C-terminal domain-containing protein [Eubacteriales bacterium]